MIHISHLAQQLVQSQGFLKLTILIVNNNGNTEELFIA